jgi:hypothetical protein
MRILADAVIINFSPSQRRLLRDPKHDRYIRGMVFEEGSSRPRIPVDEVSGLIARLTQLQGEIVADREYARRRPQQVIEQIILKLNDAREAHSRNYPKPQA